MNSEKRTLCAFTKSRKFWEEVSGLITADDFTTEGGVVYSTISEYYMRDNDVVGCDIGFIFDDISSKHPKHATLLCSILDNYEDVSVPNARAQFNEFLTDSTGNRLAEAILSKDTALTRTLLDKYQRLQESGTIETDSKIIIDENIHSILESVQPENLITVYPKALNDRLDGGVIGGTQIAIYAPTEVGKSLLSINMACGFMIKGHKVLYCGNEDPSKMMLMRFFSRLSGMTRAEMLADPEEAQRRARDNGYGNLVYYDMSPGSLYEVTKAIEKYKPKIAFFDQMANMDAGVGLSKVEKNEYLAAKLRSIAKKNDIVTVIVHQASDSAYGKLVVEKNDMYFSNVGVQGQMDLMIGIGMDSAYDQQNKRMLCLTKNKINSNHDNFPVVIDPALTKVIGV